GFGRIELETGHSLVINEIDDNPCGEQQRALPVHDDLDSLGFPKKVVIGIQVLSRVKVKLIFVVIGDANAEVAWLVNIFEQSVDLWRWGWAECDEIVMVDLCPRDILG